MPVLIRHFVAFLGFAISVQVHADEVIRIMAANTSSGNLQSYDPGHGNRIFQGLDPDIALVQEMNVGTSPNKNTAATYRAWVTANFGSSFSYFVEPSGNIPNGIVSRYPILAAGEWDDSTMTDRDYVWARIDIPGDKDLWAVSVHISSSGGSSQRNKEAGEIKKFITDNVPSGDYLVLGGDLNTDSRGEACISTFDHAKGGVVVVSGPFPVDRNGTGALEGTNASRAKPYDWVLPDPDLDALKTPLVIGSQTFANGLVFDSRVFTPLSDVSPILVSDSSASGMQHMAVMRAFLIPVNTAPTVINAADSSSTEVVTDPDSSVYEIVRGNSVGLAVSAADNGGEPALKYTWSFASGPGTPVTFSTNGTNVAKNTTATFHEPGDYTLTVTIQDAQGLSVTSSIKVRVIQAADAWTLWKDTHFTAPEQSAGLAADPADPDADGWSNLAEYALGSDPRAFTPPLPFVVNEAGLSITFTRPAGLPGIRYFAETSANLGIWVPLTLELLETGPVETLRAIEPKGDEPAARHFLRLRFERE